MPQHHERVLEQKVNNNLSFNSTSSSKPFLTIVLTALNLSFSLTSLVSATYHISYPSIFARLASSKDADKVILIPFGVGGGDFVRDSFLVGQKSLRNEE